MRLRRFAWWCWLGHRNEPGDLRCRECDAPLRERHAQVHSAERTVIYQHPLTGERRIPARADQALPEVYRAQGFERREILSMSAYERETGLVHEATNYNSADAGLEGTTPHAPAISPQVREALVQDMRQAFASGPFTGGLPEGGGASEQTNTD